MYFNLSVFAGCGAGSGIENNILYSISIFLLERCETAIKSCERDFCLCQLHAQETQLALTKALLNYI